jgi:hypothetical protein
MRYDRSPIGKLVGGPDGSLRGDAVITRAGVFHYQGPSGETVREFRSPEEVFKADSLASARMIPVTVEHPKEGRVTPDNAKQLAVGWTGESVRQDGSTLVAPVRIFAADGIKAIEGGKRQLSLGYKCEVERRDGVWNGEQYDSVQTNIDYNHLAVVDAARAGAVASVRLDAADAVQITEPPPTPTKGPGAGRSDAMNVQLRLDSGCSYEVPQEVEAAFRAKTEELAALRTKLDAAETEKSDAIKAKDTAEGERDSAKAELEKATKNDSAIDAAVKARMSLFDTARKAKLDKEITEKLDSMSNKDIRIAVIKSQQEKFDAEGKSDEYINARFDGVVEQLALAPDISAQLRGDGSGGSETRTDVASARAAYAKSLKENSRRKTD